MALNTHNIIYAGLYIQKQKKCLILPSFQLYEYVRKKSPSAFRTKPHGIYAHRKFKDVSLRLSFRKEK